MPNLTNIKSNLMPQTSRFNHLAILISLPLILFGCADDSEVVRGEVGNVTGFYGAVTGDEPNSVLVAKSVLANGGTAVDAAVAMTFAMTVTMPVNVSLAGGGVCIVHDADAGITEALDFIGPPGTGPQGDRPTAVPALVRGMVALHARYGSFDWRLLVSPAERMARQGHRISRATASELKRAARPLFADIATRAIFMDDAGQPLTEGTRMRQLDLAGMLGRVRAKGGGIVYQGPQARLIVDAVQQAGGSLSMEDMRNYKPSWKSPIVVPVGDDLAYFTPPSAGSGIMGAQILAMLQEDDLYLDTPDDVKPYLMAELIKRLYADRSRYMNDDWTLKQDWESLVTEDHINGLVANYNSNQATQPENLNVKSPFDENPAGSGLVVVDRFGMAVSCELSLNNMFGTGRIAPGTGTFMAAAPTGRGRNPLAFGPVIVANPQTFAFRYGAAASGGRGRIGGLANNMATVLLSGDSLKKADGLTRMAVSSIMDEVYLEQTAGDDMYKMFAARGQALRKARQFGRVNAIHCPNGLPDFKGNRQCDAQQDSRGHGLALFAY